MNNKPKYNLFKNTQYAIDGLRHAFKTETSFTLELIVSIFILYFERFSNMDIKEAIQRVHSRLNIQNPDEKYIFNRLEKSHFETKNTKNVVLLMQESMGYHPLFIYGGESRFDNMKSWFLGNGFSEIIDQAKFRNPNYRRNHYAY